MIEDILKNDKFSSGGRRWLTSEQKSLIVTEWEKSGLSGPEFGRRYGIILVMLYKWRKDAFRGATMGIKNQGDLYTKAELESLRKENDELKKALAESHLDIRILKKKLEMDAKGQIYKAPRNLPGGSK
jgi:transposase